MAPPLKDNIDRAAIERLAGVVAEVAGQAPDDSNRFGRDQFIATVADRLPDLELKDRVNLVADELAASLPNRYPEALAIVVEVAERDLGEWISWPLCSFVERHGVDWPTDSLEAMATLTRFFSCEFAIRPYLDRHLAQTRTYLRRWVNHGDDAVRRLPSEGTRPLLPWGPKVPVLLDDPSIGIELLDRLRHDRSETVRRSVANHLNDVAKAHPDLVVSVLQRWIDQAAVEGVELDGRMVRHGLRTLVKTGHRGSLELLGFTTEPEVEVVAFDCAPSPIELGSTIELSAQLRSRSESPQRLVVDFVIHHVLASGATAPKVFKWTTIDLDPGETASLTKKRTIQTASTRRYHAGVHQVDLQVAGAVSATTEFNLTNSS